MLIRGKHVVYTWSIRGTKDSLAERIRRRRAMPMSSARVGSNLAVVANTWQMYATNMWQTRGEYAAYTWQTRGKHVKIRNRYAAKTWQYVIEA